MKNDTQLSNIIYEFFLMRFHFAYYGYGDTLPPIDTMCKEFSVAPETVKNALRTLRSEGYIDMHNGRLTKVVYRQTEIQRQEAVRTYFAARHAASIDLYESAGQILVPLLTQCLHRMAPEDLSRLEPYAERGKFGDVLAFFCSILQALNNPLAMNLFWETSFFVGLFFLDEDTDPDFHDSSASRIGMAEIISCCRGQDWLRLDDVLAEFKKTFFQRAAQYISQYKTDSVKQIPFTWRIYYGRPQVCYQLATRILHSIYIGDYSHVPYLPSYEKMAKEYAVSVSTIRRTVHVLNQLGVTVSVNGIGTRIFSTPGTGNTPVFESPAIRRNIALYYQAYEIIAYSCEYAFRPTLLALTSDQTESLIWQLKDNLQRCRCEFTYWHLLICISRHNPFPAIREIYSRIYSLFIWGYPLKFKLADTSEYDRENRKFTESILAELTAGNLDNCIAVFNCQIARLFPVLERFLAKYGVSQEELRIPPSARMPGDT